MKSEWEKMKLNGNKDKKGDIMPIFTCPKNHVKTILHDRKSCNSDYLILAILAATYLAMRIAIK